MDPNANLAEQLRLAREIQSTVAAAGAHGLSDDARDGNQARGERLAELVVALQAWRERAGLSPADPRPASDPLAALYDTADDHEQALLDDLLVRAGLRWRCQAPRREDQSRPCGWLNQADDEACDGCRAARP